jgi:hypothetical protein
MEIAMRQSPCEKENDKPPDDPPISRGTEIHAASGTVFRVGADGILATGALSEFHNVTVLDYEMPS